MNVYLTSTIYIENTLNQIIVNNYKKHILLLKVDSYEFTIWVYDSTLLSFHEFTETYEFDNLGCNKINVFFPPLSFLLCRLC